MHTLHKLARHAHLLCCISLAPAAFVATIIESIVPEPETMIHTCQPSSSDSANHAEPPCAAHEQHVTGSHRTATHEPQWVNVKNGTEPVKQLQQRKPCKATQCKEELS